MLKRHVEYIIIIISDSYLTLSIINFIKVGAITFFFKKSILYELKYLNKWNQLRRKFKTLIKNSLN